MQKVRRKGAQHANASLTFRRPTPIGIRWLESQLLKMTSVQSLFEKIYTKWKNIKLSTLSVKMIDSVQGKQGVYNAR